VKLLLIEDEYSLGRTIADSLQKEGYLCEWSKDYDTGEEMIAMYDYDCVLIDITLPGGSGLDLLKMLKEKNPATGIIILTARQALEDKVKGLDLGADDYLAKPFHIAELHSRIRSLLRRKQFNGSRELQFGSLRILPEECRVHIHTKELTLTRREFDLLLFFSANPNRLITREAIAEHLWGEESDAADSFDFIYSHIKNLRKKITDAGGEEFIVSVYGMGYKFIVP
jgi:DNA-binding response OmpR family regulator